jgi:hypothetical protein
MADDVSPVRWHAPYQPLELLEPRKLLSTISIANFGAAPNDNRDDSSAFISAIRVAGAGDTVLVPAGTFDVGRELTLKSGITVAGEGATSAIKFDVGRRGFGFIVPGNAKHVVIRGLDMASTGGIVSLNKGSLYEDIQIIGNKIENHGGQFGIYASIRSNGLIIERNHFHDSLDSLRPVELFYINEASYSFNTFYMYSDGGHILNPHNNVRVVGNVGRKIHRMGIEIQGEHVSQNLLVQGNVYYDWHRPYHDTFGLSVVAHHGINTQILDNYLAATFDGIWGVGHLPSEQNRFGYGIEAGFKSGKVDNNVVVGPWVTHIVVSTKNTMVSNNKLYGRTTWGYITGEPGPNGFGNAISINNQIFPGDSGWPEPPTTLPGGGGIGGGGWVPGGGGNPDPEPTPGQTVPILSAFVVDTSKILLSWTDFTTDEDGFRLERSLNGREYTVIWDSEQPNGPLQHTDKNLPAGTQFWYRVYTYKGDTNGAYSNVVTRRTKGSPTGGGGTGRGFDNSFFNNGQDDPRGNLFGDSLIG